MRLKLSDIFLNESFMPLRSLSVLREEDLGPGYGDQDDEDIENSDASNSDYESVEEPEEIVEANCSEDKREGEEKLSEEDEKMLESWRRISGIRLNS